MPCYKNALLIYRYIFSIISNTVILLRKVDFRDMKRAHPSIWIFGMNKANSGKFMYIGLVGIQKHKNENMLLIPFEMATKKHGWSW